MSGANEFLSFEIMDDPEMMEIGHRLIEQGSELLDVTDMDESEKKEAEKNFSESWNHLYRVKTVRDAYLRMAQGKTPLKLSSGESKVSNLGDLLRNFLFEIIHTLDYLSRLAKLCTRGRMAVRSYLKDYASAWNACEKDFPEHRVRNLNDTISSAEAGWLRELRDLYRQINDEKNLCLLFQPHHNGVTELKFLDGRLVGQTVMNFWNSLTAFAEDFTAYWLQLRFLDFVSGLKVIPRQEQDLVYPRKFKVLIQGASSGNEERPV